MEPGRIKMTPLLSDGTIRRVGQEPAFVDSTVGAQRVLGIVTIPRESFLPDAIVDGEYVVRDVAPAAHRCIGVACVVGADHIIHEVLGIEQFLSC